MDQVECSANHFGVKLRKVSPDGGSQSSSTEKLNSLGRKSAPPGAPSNCDSRITARRSVNPSQVAARQNKAEKEAIERQKRPNSRSWEKRSKPLLPPKPLIRSSSSLGNIAKSSTPLVRRSTLASQRKSPLTRDSSERVRSRNNNISAHETDEEDGSTEDLSYDEDSVCNWLMPRLPFYQYYMDYKPALDALYLRVSDAMKVQGQSPPHTHRLVGLWVPVHHQPGLG